MNKILQMLELILQTMEREPKRLKAEIFDGKIVVQDLKNIEGRIFPAHYTYHPEPTSSYQEWCNEMFGYFLNDLDKTPFLEKGIITQNEYESGEITLNDARNRFGLDPIEDGHKLVTIRTLDEVS